MGQWWNNYWLNGMAGTGKMTIAYSFGEILHEKDSLGGTFFCSHLRVDTSDVRYIICTISLHLVHYFPSLSLFIMDVVEDHLDYSAWGIGKQFLYFMIKPLTAVYRDTRGVSIIPAIVLDALDECSDQSLVLELLSCCWSEPQIVISIMWLRVTYIVYALPILFLSLYLFHLRKCICLSIHLLL